jgi:hypothetical protein
MRDYQNTAKRMAAIIRLLRAMSCAFGTRRRPAARRFSAIRYTSRQRVVIHDNNLNNVPAPLF